MKRYLAILLAAAMLLCCSCSVQTAEPNKELVKALEKMTSIVADDSDYQITPIDRTPREPWSAIVHTEINYDDMHYEVYDSSEFMSKCERLPECTDVREVIKLYDWLYDEFVVLSSYYSICYIEYCRDVNNETLQDDQVELETIANDCWDAFCCAVRDTLAGPCGERFAEYIGEDAAEAYADYEDMTERERELDEEESRLVQLYYEQIDDEDAYTYRYNGRDWTMSMLEGLAGMRLGYNDYVNIYYGIQEEMNKVIGETYLQLVAVRTEIAQLAGYDSYADYAYENTYGRDYTTDDAQIFCDSVKESVGSRFYNEVYANSLISSSFSWDTSKEYLYEILETYTQRLDPRLVEPYEYMKRNNLLTADSGDGMMQGGFTTSIDMYNAPYIYVYLDYSTYDVGTIVHEYGHFCDNYWNPASDAFLSSGSYDIFEIHSTGLEVIFLRFYDEIFGDKSSAAEYYTLLNLLYCVVSGCLMDEFQRKVYDNPDMTLDEINQLYYDLCIAYGEPVYSDVDYGWMNVRHNFESPMYYISYAVSAIVSLQIWNIQQTDEDKALEIYLDILGHGGHDIYYKDLLEDVGLTGFYVEGAAGDICGPVIEYCANLE